MKKLSDLFSAVLAAVIVMTCLSFSAFADKYKTVGGIKYVYTDSGKKKGPYTGWLDGRDKSRSYYKDGVMLKDTWLTEGGKQTYYFDSKGKMVTGEYTKNGNWYLFGDDGKIIAGVGMTVGNVSRTGLTLDISGLVVSDKKTAVTMTEAYTIEYKTSNGVWKERDVNGSEKLRSKTYKLIVKGKLKSFAINIDWEKVYGALPAGEYRLTKTLTVKKKSGVKENKSVSVDFSFKSASDAEKKLGVVLSVADVTNTGLTLKTYQDSSINGYVTWNGIYTLEYRDSEGKWREVDISARLSAKKNNKFNNINGIFGKKDDPDGNAGGSSTEKITFYTKELGSGYYRIKRIFFGDCNGNKGQFYGTLEFEITE